MKKSISLIAFTAVLISTFLLLNKPEQDVNIEHKFIPSEWFYSQRAFPHGFIPVEKYYAALSEKENMLGEQSAANGEGWYPVGPGNIGGRITAMDYDPINNIIYAGAAAGGIFKSTNFGESWIPKTDFHPSLSIGALVIDPLNSNIIYCGTGEANISTDSYAGFGMLKSTDYGETWVVSGLEESRHIAELEVHPANTDILYAAVSGGLYSKGPDRGIYKSTDAGGSWSKVLFVSDSTSAIDVAIDPNDVNIVYAAMWERLRGPSFRKAAGISGGIYKSTDGGNNWNQLLVGLPSPDPIIGRISIAVAQSNSNYVYALYKKASSPNGSSNTFHKFFRSTDKGDNWTEMPSGFLSSEFSSFGWYFGVLEVDPSDHLTVYCGDVDLFKSSNGGNNWQNITNSYSGNFDQQHPDQHSLWINPANPDELVNGNDGGVFSSVAGGAPWAKSYDLPISQFYATEIDFLQPEIKVGGTQDNGTLMSDGTINNWDHILGGDGFHAKIDYTNSNIIYAESQNGGIRKSTNGGLSFNWAGNGIDFARTNWSTPYTLDVQDPNILYLGTYKLHRTTNGAGSWSAISPDLTRGPNGRMGTITCVSSAVEDDNTTRVIYVGTDDAKLSVTTNSGTNWEDKTGVLPQRYMTDVLSDKREPSVAYVTLSGYNLDETNPHIFRATDYGVTWNDISGNIPDVPVNSIIIDYDKDSTLYVGTDAGVFYTEDLGISWNVLGSGLPNSPVFDINYHQPTRKLVAGTHGRSLFEFDLSVISSVEGGNNINVKGFELYQNYPNPFNPTTKIKFTIPSVGAYRNTPVQLIVYNVLGKEVATLVNSEQISGTYSVTFDASDLSSGIYFYKVTSGNFSQTKKMILLR
ncbi:T9SS type A sorting domain-containing protein [Bacteroidota bacterium]